MQAMQRSARAALIRNDTRRGLTMQQKQQRQRVHSERGTRGAPSLMTIGQRRSQLGRRQVTGLSRAPRYSGPARILRRAGEAARSGQALRAHRREGAARVPGAAGAQQGAGTQDRGVHPRQPERLHLLPLGRRHRRPAPLRAGQREVSVEGALHAAHDVGRLP